MFLPCINKSDDNCPQLADYASGGVQWLYVCAPDVICTQIAHKQDSRKRVKNVKQSCTLQLEETEFLGNLCY